MRHIRRRGLALPLISGLAAVSMLWATSQAAATEDPAQRHRPAGHAKDRTTHHETHTVASGNTLWEIAEDHYGDGTAWWALFGANAETIGKTARDHGHDGGDIGDIGHWIFPGTELALPDPAAMKTNAQAVQEALEHVLTQHPRLLGSTLCPEAQAPEDIGECFLGLLDQAPLLLDRLDFLEEVSSGGLLELVEPLIACVMEGEDPAACLTEALADLPATG
ncbi:LysM peptidoglycan-binding domain-containing protein [Streptomyces sp. NPDC051740]|uniref:LysM peptidoglycan-binding domain-containing protein n=1 Tax=Streptomyces sp. NPDC051740 TaxID=3365673 RepID=UPI0037A743AA